MFYLIFVYIGFFKELKNVSYIFSIISNDPSFNDKQSDSGCDNFIDSPPYSDPFNKDIILSLVPLRVTN